MSQLLSETEETPSAASPWPTYPLGHHPRGDGLLGPSVEDETSSLPLLSEGQLP